MKEGPTRGTHKFCHLDALRSSQKINTTWWHPCARICSSWWWRKLHFLRGINGRWWILCCCVERYIWLRFVADVLLIRLQVRARCSTYIVGSDFCVQMSDQDVTAGTTQSPTIITTVLLISALGWSLSYELLLKKIWIWRFFITILTCPCCCTLFATTLSYAQKV